MRYSEVTRALHCALSDAIVFGFTLFLESNGNVSKIHGRRNKTLAAVGFEPTPPKRLVPKTSALDHSATLPCAAVCLRTILTFCRTQMMIQRTTEVIFLNLSSEIVQ